MMNPEDNNNLEGNIFSLRKQINYLDSLGSHELQNWLERSLRGYPYPIKLGLTEAYERIKEIYSHSNPALQQGIQVALANLIRSWSGEFHDLIYLDSLLFLAGRLRIIGAYKFILSWAYQQRFKNRFANDYQKITGEDLHLNCLRVIGPQGPPGDEKLLEVCLRDIEDDAHPHYFGVCYHILWQQDYKYLIAYFPRFIKLCMLGYYEFINTFNFINQMHEKKFWNNFEGFYYRLNKSEQLFFLGSLFKLNLTTSKHDNIIIGNLRYVFENEIPSEIDLSYFKNNPLYLAELMKYDRKVKDYLYTPLSLKSTSSDYPIYIHSLLLNICGYSQQHPLSVSRRDNILPLFEEYNSILNEVMDKSKTMLDRRLSSYPAYHDELSTEAVTDL